MTQNTKTSTARIIAMGIASTGAASYRDQAALDAFSPVVPDWEQLTENKKASKPVFEIHEREVAKREFALTLMKRNNANHLTEVSSIKLGLYGKRLDKPAKAEQEPAPVVDESSPEHPANAETA